MKILTKGQYYGDQSAERTFRWVHLSQYGYSTERTDWHYHENPYFMYVLQGNMKDCNKRVETLCPAGSLMFNNWQEPHYGSKHTDQGGGFHLEFEKSWLAENGISLQLWEGSQRIDNPQLHLLFAQIYQEFLLSDEFSPVAVELLLVQVCDALSQVKQAERRIDPQWVANLRELLHFEQDALDLKQLSHALDIHPVHLSRAAPKYLTMGLGRYIREQKLKKSLPLLFDPKLRLTEIAYIAGFSDQSHFTRVFKGYFKVSPRQYRQRIGIRPQC